MSVSVEQSTPRSLTRLTGLLLLLCAASVGAQTVSTDYTVETVTTGLEHPWSLAFLPDNRMLVTERAGRLRLINQDDVLITEPVSGLPEDIYVDAQAGLKDLLLAPDFEDSGELHFSYACGTAEANTTCLARATLEGRQLHNVEVIFRADPLREGSVHYGGRLARLPDDTLLLTLGDGFSYRNEAQNRQNHIGKIVRLNPDGSVPADNPFVDDPDTRDEIFTLGHRNPQGILYDADTDRIIAHEHGPRGGDELNIIRAGENYGWPLITTGVDYTGARITPFTELPGLTTPILTWTPALAPSGITRYDGFLFPDWRGDYFIGGLAGQSVRRVRLHNGDATEEEVLFADRGDRFRDVRTGPDGALYLLTDRASGSVLRVVPDR
ncbi:PQQ-dependent sugar dehydrogenase [Natronospirillum operosum]|uniref:PQQ-dependent sugar dehydrogenase n=1 Tax=Natronospirillum operosum TaxID=2759953 RepID=A0A4Z0W9N4_9GAMM|nr:PQQ-dependent sugar dehydrogenase [Natronospirillum operosum]TGG95329.1 PQQ-dependent sugar dehydrogenase [Natronospirillum operosum]